MRTRGARPDDAGSPREDVIDPTDVGDTDPDYTGDPVDPLLGEAFSTILGSATVLFAVTEDVEAFYEDEVPDGVASAIAPLSSSGEDIADAVRLALARVAGVVTQRGGNATDDLLVGTPDNDGLFGLGGNDTIIGLAGDDVIDGGSGDDRLNGGEGNDDIRGGTGNDVIFDGMGDDRIDGGDGEDTIYVFAGTNDVRGGLGDDYVSGGVGEDSLRGGPGDDVLRGGAGTDTFAFGPGDGSDVVKDFSGDHDRLDFTDFPDITGLSDLTVTVDADGTTVSLAAHGGGEIRLEGFTASLEAKHCLSPIRSRRRTTIPPTSQRREASRSTARPPGTSRREATGTGSRSTWSPARRTWSTSKARRPVMGPSMIPTFAASTIRTATSCRERATTISGSRSSTAG